MLRLLVGLLLFSVTPGSRTAEESNDATRRLAEVRSRIEEISRRLGASQIERDEAAASLRRVEVSAAEAVRALEKIRLTVAESERQLADLGAEQGRQAARLATHNRALAKQIRASYLLGREDRLKLVLNQEDPSTVSRALAYAGYFQRARVDRIRDLGETMTRLRITEAEIRTVAARLRNLEEDKQRLGMQLAAQREQREAVLAALESRVETTGQVLGRLRQDETELTALIEDVAREIARLPFDTEERALFSTLKGHLPWPSDGPLRYRFGTPRESGDLRWQGVVIATDAGHSVRAISHGRIAYADWLRGFGLLLIVDHGDGYMSLYGYNESLLKEVGEWVDGGEVVGTVGDSGGHRAPGVYFEIRHSGIPVDPGNWCVERVAKSALVTSWR